MQALLAGFHLHTPKPLDPAELAAVVASLAMTLAAARLLAVHHRR